jgi:hypothetical protein
MRGNNERRLNPLLCQVLRVVIIVKRFYVFYFERTTDREMKARGERAQGREFIPVCCDSNQRICTLYSFFFCGLVFFFTGSPKTS